MVGFGAAGFDPGRLPTVRPSAWQRVSAVARRGGEGGGFDALELWGWVEWS